MLVPAMSFLTEFTRGMPPAFRMPDEFLSLAQWCESRGLADSTRACIADPELSNFGFAYLYGSLREPWPEGYPPTPGRLWSVGTSGADGSEFCLWIDASGTQQVVHHGSGTGSTLWAVMPSAMSVLRLLAVGYEEPCVNTDWGDAPTENTAALEPYREWLRTTWGQTLPRTGLEALGVSGREGTEWLEGGPKNDPFDAWLLGE